MEIIRTELVSKTYKDEGIKVKAVKAVSLKINTGEFTAIVGPSGSGKTTLLNLISGLDIPTSGKVYLAGKNINTMTGNALSDFRRDHIGFIFQSYNLIPVLTAEENIEYIMMLQGVDTKERKERVKKILADVDMAGFAHRRPPQLSGGQQQRVAIARAMVSGPSIILADEPTANLDSETGGALLHMMRDLNKKRGMTFVFSTHDKHIMEHAKRLVVLQDGEVVKDERR
jgi:putative ABC transport system ATP-binding protein